MRDYKKYEVWNLAMGIAKESYQITNSFPIEERFNLISQLRRSAVSIPSNVAEGCARSTDKEFKRFLEISMGSVYELETQLVLSKHFNYVNENELEALLEKINHFKASLNSLITKLKH